MFRGINCLSVLFVCFFLLRAIFADEKHLLKRRLGEIFHMLRAVTYIYDNKTSKVFQLRASTCVCSAFEIVELHFRASFITAIVLTTQNCYRRSRRVSGKKLSVKAFNDLPIVAGDETHLSISFTGRAMTWWISLCVGLQRK
jgi:predicted transporter